MDLDQLLTPEWEWEESQEQPEANAADWSVSYLVEHLNRALHAVLDWDQIWVTGEVSGWKVYPSGHAYFTLKDTQGQISCTFFKFQLRRLSEPLQDGQQVRLQGKAQIYNGRLQFQVNQAERVGQGNLYEEYCRRKERLEREGLFVHARPLPILPRRVGVVTSPKGAVIRDIIQVSTRRFPGCQILLFPSAVQGSEAPAQLIAGVRALQEVPDVDVIIVGRGGGSIEDLWCFNDENLVRELFVSRVPVVSAVGHETDHTLCDFVSDHRAPTPSAAAELVWPDVRTLRQKFVNLDRHLLDRLLNLFYRYQSRLNECERVCQAESAKRMLDRKRLLVQSLLARCQQYRPDLTLQRKRMRCNELYQQLHNQITTVLRSQNQSLRLHTQQLQVLNPRQVLGRGYALVTDAQGSVLTGIKQIQEGQQLQLEMQDGCVQVEVTEKNKEDADATTAAGSNANGSAD